PTPWSRTRCSTRLSHSPNAKRNRPKKDAAGGHDHLIIADAVTVADVVTTVAVRRPAQGVYLIDQGDKAVKNMSGSRTLRYFVYANSNGHSPNHGVCSRFCCIEQRKACAKVLAERAAAIADRRDRRAVRSDFHRRSVGRTYGLDGRHDPDRRSFVSQQG